MTGSVIHCLVALLIVGAAPSGCASSRAPEGWLPSTSKAQQDSYGGWLYLESLEEDRNVTYEGEFIAVKDSFVYLLPRRGRTVEVGLRGITFAVLEHHEKETGKLAGWAIGGTLATASHGGYFILSSPIWLVAGTLSTMAVSRLGSNEQEFPDSLWWESVSRYARFPQGLPASVNIDQLVAKRK